MTGISNLKFDELITLLKENNISEFYFISDNGITVSSHPSLEHLKNEIVQLNDFLKHEAILLEYDSDTNSLLTNHPDLYQHSAMHWFHVHTQDLELATAHESAFFTAVDDINALADEVRGAASVANQYNYHTGGTM